MGVTYRPPKKSDMEGLLAFINELADEDTYIKAERQTRPKERKWLDAQLKAIGKKNWNSGRERNPP